MTENRWSTYYLAAKNKNLSLSNCLSGLSKYCIKNQSIRKVQDRNSHSQRKTTEIQTDFNVWQWIGAFN